MKIKTKSIANNLIFKLNLTLVILLLIVFASIYLVAKNEINQIFDAELKKAGLVVFEIAKNHKAIDDSDQLESKLHQKFLNRYDYDVGLQIWNNRNLIYNSGSKIKLNEPSIDGFFDLTYQDFKWRAFVYFDEATKYKIALYEKYNIRESLILEISSVISIIFTFSCFLIISLIIAVVNRELKPINQLSEQIKMVNLINFKEIDYNLYPKEIQSFVESFNQLIAKLQKVLENEKKFTDYAAHELNTPLAAIRLQTQILQNDHEKNKNPNFDKLINAVDRASHLIKQLLTLARIENESNYKNFTKLNICSTIDEIIDELKTSSNITNKNIEQTIPTITKHYSKESQNIKIQVHKFFFKIMLNNLMENAIKYSSNNKNIEIFVENKNDNLLITINNESEEIGHEDQARIFEKFFRANKSTSTKNIEGCGLGLSIAKEIAEMHKTKINFSYKNHRVSVSILLNNKL